MKNQKNKQDQPKAEKNGVMPLSGHLRELRNRLGICIVALVAAFLIALYFSQDLISFLTDMGAVYGYEFIYISPQELLMQQFSIALVAAVCLCLPLILYHLWAFIQPGLKADENVLFLAALFSGLLFFVIGILFAYKVMLPFMLKFLIDISSGSGITASISVEKYLNFLLTIFLVFGIIFELPVVSVLLTQMGLLKVEWMKKGFKLAIVVIFFIAAVVTPPDIVSQTMVALPMLLLYQFSILLSSLLLRLHRKKPAGSEHKDE
ncbi:MAG: twin-arginine translocase subunit TatC [Lachnospiraceae bacterium]|nr:twin-arginine translocase subunit TatC [Lachnospiraceae bacterium]